MAEPKPSFPHVGSALFGATLAILGVALTQHWLGPQVLQSSMGEDAQILSQVHQHLTEDYVKPRDAKTFTRSAVAGMVESLDDPYSHFLGPEDLAALHEDSTGQMFGIGAMLAPDHRIRWPRPGGPAEIAGLLPGDLIRAIDGVSTKGLPLTTLVAQIKGEAGTEVTLNILRDDEVADFVITRGAVPIDTVGRRGILDKALGLGYIHVRAFSAATEAEFDGALDELVHSGMRALILDLRFNTGGRLASSTAVASHFLEKGLVCTLQSRSGNWLRRVDSKRTRFTDLPIVILQNQWSASASEVLAGALRDYGAAVLVGTRSYGKGVYQDVREYKTGQFAIKFTAGHYVTPSGRILEGHLFSDLAGGLEPDLHIATSAAESTALQIWLQKSPPPAVYLDSVKALFPSSISEKPADSALDAATGLLRQALQP